MGLGLSPFAHQLLELRIAALGQYETHRGEQIAFAVLHGKALAFEAEGAPRAGAGRNGKFDRAFERRHAHLGAEYRLVERDRKLEPQVGTTARKQRMRRDRDDDQKIANTSACAGGPLPFQPDGLAGIFTSTSLPVGSCTRLFVPLAASSRVMVSAAVTSRPTPKSSCSNWKLPGCPERAAPPNASFKISSKPPKPRNPPPRPRAC